MPVTDKIKRYGIGGIGYPVGPVQLVGPISGDTSSELYRLGGSFGTADRWEIKGPEGLAAGDYTITVGPYSDAGLSANHRSLGDMAVLWQQGGVELPTAPVTCLGRSRPRDTASAIALGPFTVAPGDRLWAVVEWRDQSTLKYQISVDFTAAEGGGTYWIRELYDGEYTDGGFYEGYVNTATAVDDNGFYYIGGAYQDEALPHVRPMLQKYGSNGDVEWARYYDLEDLIPMPVNQIETAYDDQYINSIIPRPAGGLNLGFTIEYFRRYTSGASTFGGFARYLIIAEADETGDLISQKSFWRVGTTVATSSHFLGYIDSAVDSTGKVILLCSGYDGSQNSLFVVQLNTNLTVAWEKKISYGSSIALDASNNIYIAGGGALTASGQGVAVTKLNSSGNLVWEKAATFASGSLTSPEVIVTKMRIDAQDSIYIVGFVRGIASFSPSTKIFGFLLKLDSAGDYVWDKFDSPASLPVGYGAKQSPVYDVRFDGDNNVYIAVNTEAGTINPPLFEGGSSSINFSFDWPAVSKFNSSGTLQWSKYVSRDAVFLDTGYYELYINLYSAENVLQVSPLGGVLLALSSTRFSYEGEFDCEFNASVVVYGSSTDFAASGTYGDGFAIANSDAAFLAASAFASVLPSGVTLSTPTNSVNSETANILDLTTVRAYTTTLAPL